eukprot:14884764-Ditylum_brightwellii.AAC.1
MTKQYSQAEFFLTKKTGTELLGAGTKNVHVPEVHNLPSTQRAIVSHAAARNMYGHRYRWNTSPPTPDIVPYASACMSHMSPQKVSKHPNTASTI